MRRRRLARRAAVVLSAIFLTGVAVTVGGVLGAFTSLTSNSGNALGTATDFTAPSASRSVIAPTTGGTPGTISPGDDYFVYAQVNDTGNPASGVATVTANLNNITTGATAVMLSSGSFSVGGQSYNYRSAAQPSNTGLTEGSKSYTLTMADNASNTRTQTGFSVNVSAALDHFTIDSVSDGHSGRSFTITVRARNSSGATLTSYTGTVSFSTNSGSIAPTTSYSFVDGVLTQAVAITGPYNTSQAITVTGGSPAKTGSSNAFTLNDRQYYFKKTTANTGTNCASATRLRDMEQGYAGADPEETFSRSTGGATHLRFCSPTFSAGETMAAGTTTVQAWTTNAAGSTCQISALAYKISGGTGTLLGSASLTIPNQSSTTMRTWSLPTDGTTFAAGDRLAISLSLQEVKACDSTDIHYGGSARRSNAQFPGPSGSAYSDTILGTSGLLGYWRLDEDAGATTAADSAGSRTGSYLGSPALAAGGLLVTDANTSVDLDGVDDRVSIPDASAPDFAGNAPYTLEAWVNPDVVDSACRRLFSKEITDASGTQGYLMYYCNGVFQMQRRQNGVSQTVSAGTTIPATVGTTRHVVGTYDGTNMRIYVNGTLVGTAASPLSLVDHGNALALGATSTGGIRVDGRLDEAAIYGRALTPDEIRAHYNAR